MADCTECIRLLESNDKEVVREGAFHAGENNCVEAVPLLAELLKTDNLGIQEAAESSLRKIGGKDSVEAVLPLLRSDEAPVRNLSMDILREIGVQDITALVALIHDDDADIRIFVSDILGSTNTVLAVEPLCEALLKDPEVNVRYQAAVSLGELGMAEAAPCLNKAIDDEEWVQYSVIEALTKIGDARSADALVKALDGASDLVASMIIDSLGELGNVKVVTLLLKRMEESPTALRNMICKSIVKILGGKSLTLLNDSERDRFRRYLLVALKDEDKAIQDAAIQGLAHVGGEKASTAILELASQVDPDKDQERLGAILGALAKIGPSDALQAGILSEDPAIARVSVQTWALVAPAECEEEHLVCEVLMGAFWKVGLDIQRQIVSIAANRADESAKDFFVKILNEHDDGTVLKSAVYLLGEKLQLPEAAELIFPLLRHQYDDVKEAALDACISIGSPAVVERLEGMFESEDPLDRLMATYGLGKLSPMDHFSILERGLEDEIPDIRKVAVEAFAEACDNTDTWQSLILDRLNDESKEVRLIAIETLGKCFSDKIVPHLIEALGDEDDWVKIRAMDALGAHKASGAAPQLIEMLGSSNRFVVMKVIESLGNLGGQSAFRALLEVTNGDDYELVEAAETAIAIIQNAQE